MTTPETGPFPKVLTLYLELSQYPILAPRIRQRMREMLFERGIINPEDLEAEARQKAIQSQQREGIVDPLAEEQPDVWARRLAIIRDNLTDFYFAYNLPHELFEDIVRDLLAGRIPSDEVVLTFHPELAPWDMLFSQGEAYEALPENERSHVEHHLQEIKVVLIKSMISDHLEYLGIAKQWLDVADLQSIRSRRLGRGKIGGKAAGIMLADAVLRKSGDEALLSRLKIPPSWFIGADVFYQYTQLNGLLHFANQKYKSAQEIQQEYDSIRASFANGKMPTEIVDGLREILREVGSTPLIVRSSSLLEDSFGTSFAGKYESYFCPNQASLQDNLDRLVEAIVSIYGSVYSPEVLLYRRRMGLIDYDERMAILIMVVQGRHFEGYFLPDAAGVAFSHNQLRWSPRIQRDDGFLRLVWGLGTRAVENIAGDYPRLVALSHPELRPESAPAEARRYSQSQVDLIDMEGNTFRTMPVQQVINASLPHLRWIAQRYGEDGLQQFLSRPLDLDPGEAVVTFEELLRRTEFPHLMRMMLQSLERAYQMPVDIEFAVLLDGEGADQPEITISLLQCRPQSHIKGTEVRLPQDVPEERVVFRTQRLVPEGHVSDIRYAVYVSPRAYQRLESNRQRFELVQLIGRVNAAMQNQRFILIGPGRWGSANPELGIPVGYSDIYNAKVLLEVFTGSQTPEPSYGTHFFQDLVEARIYPLAVASEDPGTKFNFSVFEGCQNILGELMPDAADWSGVLRIVDIPACHEGQSLEIVMDGEADTALAYLALRSAPPAQDAPPGNGRL